jgi:hypothetical protein
MKYTKKIFEKEFPTDDVCLDYIFNQRFGKDFECPKCQKVDSFVFHYNARSSSLHPFHLLMARISGELD